eukprot:gnl/TRDRNA2_/TRDRNA2_38227_c0_seq1.p1 gnl/TRDRNA2_/TRDRNA2_38227_c0~~gnl/TRDRNA2_/TRDRNA2_38227_c0_seq1.p1  ORF type:complete len:395 (+),score=61.39 gnl/TRDRNA2_/TRDRNA2_38227_c0_seq1:64-1248(+)
MCCGGRLAALLAASLLSVASAMPASGHLRTPRRYRSLGTDDASSCPVCGDAEVVGHFPAEIGEASGLAASIQHKDVLYIVSDGAPEWMFWAVSGTGELLSRFTLTGIDYPEGMGAGEPAANGKQYGDMEAISVGPCAGGLAGDCIFIADTGCNCARPASNCTWLRKEGTSSLMQFQEPASLPRDGSTVQLEGQRLWFKFPNSENFDVETLMVSPQGELFIVNKLDAGSHSLFRIPAASSDHESPAVAERVVDLKKSPQGGKFDSSGVPEDAVTDGSLQVVDGQVVGVSLTTSRQMQHYKVSSNIQAALETEPCLAPYPSSVNHVEGLSWDRENGGSYLFLKDPQHGESPKKDVTHHSLYKVQCKASPLMLESSAVVRVPAFWLMTLVIMIVFTC